MEVSQFLPDGASGFGMTKYENFKNSRWRKAAILEIVFWP